MAPTSDRVSGSSTDRTSPERPATTRVLVVDPSPSTSGSTRTSLETLGYRVTVCASNKDALERLQVDTFDVVLADHSLTGESGLTIVRAVEALGLAVPVIVMTTTADPGLKPQVIAAGGHDILPRSAPLDLFRLRIEGAIAGKRDEKPRILVVDDDPLVLKLLKMVLAARGWEVVTAESAVAAWDKLHVKRIHVVVSDFTMAEHSGLELLENMRKQSIRIPFILLAARISDEQLARANALGAAEAMLKSSDLTPLIAAIEAALEDALPGRRS